ncbi:MAG: Hsp70 family protein [Myxococcales bacterium]|nr:Hsp70 family protein [Myxococcales bacterium]
MSQSCLAAIDFGTTNSAIAVAQTDVSPRLLQWRIGGRTTETYRSVIFFDEHDKDPTGRPKTHTGPYAIAAYLDAGGEGRLIQSIKTYLKSRSFTSTNIGGVNYTIEALIAILLRDLRRSAEAEHIELGDSLVLGRPVHFAGSVTEGVDDGDHFAVSRLRKAAALAGFTNVVFEYEPIAAAWSYEQRLDHDELILIGDFGGGTSDFCILNVGPTRLQSGARNVLGTAGVGIAGDIFDARLVRHAVAPALGLGDKTRSPFGTIMEIPRWIYSHLERWHLLSFLNTPKNQSMLADLIKQARRPEKLVALSHIVSDNLGYSLYSAVESTKVTLSTNTTAHIRFDDPPAVIDEMVTRNDFDQWILSDVDRIIECADNLLVSCNVTPNLIDRVFLTGGTSFLPQLRKVFEARFGPQKIVGGKELLSVATGLGYRAQQILERYGGLTDDGDMG